MITIPDKSDQRILRHVRFIGHPGLRLLMWDTNTYDRMGKSKLGYAFYLGENPLFVGDDFCGSPMYPVDSDSVVLALMFFLTLRRGYTDREYFEKYNREQLAWSDSSECENLQYDVLCAEDGEELLEDIP